VATLPLAQAGALCDILAAPLIVRAYGMKAARCYEKRGRRR
jgi:hypothetical protein